MKKKKMQKIFFSIIFLSKTTVNPLRKQNPYHGNKTLIMVTALTDAFSHFYKIPLVPKVTKFIFYNISSSLLTQKPFW